MLVSYKKDLHGLPSTSSPGFMNISILVDCKGPERDGCILEFKEYLKILISCIGYVVRLYVVLLFYAVQCYGVVRSPARQKGLGEWDWNAIESIYNN